MSVIDPLALSPRDAAAFLSISKRSLSRLIRARKIEARKNGPRTLVDVASLKAYYASLPKKTDHVPIVFGAALARCTALIDNRDAAATAVERMAARLLSAVCRPNAGECTKGRFFDRASDKLNQLARFATNELVSVDLQAMAAALSSHS